MIDNTLYEKNILIVDDDQSFNLMVEDMLYSNYAKPTIANTIQEAIVLWQRKSFDFIILDGHLPDGDAEDFIQHDFFCRNDTPIFLVTVDDDQSFIHHHFTLGISDCLIKPINLDLLWLKMERYYESHITKIKKKAYHRQLKQLLLEKQKEEELARYVYSHLTKNNEVNISFFDLTMYSTSEFNGDLFLSAKSPSGNQFAILLDATGHGLAASITVLPLVSMFKTMVAKGFSLPYIVHELNDKLCYQIPDDRFVAGIVLEINPTNKTLTVWNGGMPDLLVIDSNCQIIVEAHSCYMPLGIIESYEFDSTPQIINLSGNEGIVLHSDGLSEQNNTQGEHYSEKRLRNKIQSSNSIKEVNNTVLKDFNFFVNNEKYLDDISLCCINLSDYFDVVNNTKETRKSKNTGKASIKICIQGSQLSEVDILELISFLSRQMDINISQRERVFTVCAELVNNAIDHGILKLESNLKNDLGRFDEYLQLRGKRLKKLIDSDKIELELKYSQESQEFSFMVTDSGRGYDSRTISPSDTSMPSGKGLRLINALSQKYNYDPKTNTTSVIIK